MAHGWVWHGAGMGGMGVLCRKGRWEQRASRERPMVAGVGADACRVTRESRVAAKCTGTRRGSHRRREKQRRQGRMQRRSSRARTVAAAGATAPLTAPPPPAGQSMLGPPLGWGWGSFSSRNTKPMRQ